MKLPRWLVIAMLTTSVLSMLAAAGWWWVTWPERTVNRFVDGRYANSFEALQEEKLQRIFDEMKTDVMWRPTVTGSPPRSLMDYLKAKQEFEFKARHSVLRLWVEMGRVVELEIRDVDENGGWESSPEILNP